MDHSHPKISDNVSPNPHPMWQNNAALGDVNCTPLLEALTPVDAVQLELLPRDCVIDTTDHIELMVLCSRLS